MGIELRETEDCRLGLWLEPSTSLILFQPSAPRLTGVTGKILHPRSSSPHFPGPTDLGPFPA